MANNTRYQPAPQRDSLEENGYSQPPPAYQAEDHTNAALLGGVPRGEDDNMPDDFKFGGVVAEATLDIRMQFVRKVYAIL
jgi:protein lifeguard